MSALGEALRARRIFNTHDLLKKFGEPRDVAVDFTGYGDARSMTGRFSAVWSPHFKTDPGTARAWADNGNKKFSGPRAESLPQAKAWAEQMYGITEWAPCPLIPNTYVPKRVVDAARRFVLDNPETEEAGQ